MLCVTCHNRNDVMLPSLSTPVGGLLHRVTWTAWNLLSYIAPCSVNAPCIAVSLWLPLQWKALSKWHGIAMTSHQSRPWVSCIGLTMMSAEHWMNWQSTRLLKVRHNDMRKVTTPVLICWWVSHLWSTLILWCTYVHPYVCPRHCKLCIHTCPWRVVVGGVHTVRDIVEAHSVNMWVPFVHAYCTVCDWWCVMRSGQVMWPGFSSISTNCDWG